MARRGERTRRFTAEPETPPRPCDQPDCPEPGEYRAPKDRGHLQDYRWFCLGHVRAYNAAWDYYKGLEPGEIEGHLRADAGWQRPTWPLGRLGAARPIDPALLRDPLGLFRAGMGEAPRRTPREEAPPELRAALDVLDLTWPLDQPTLRARYKELAKRFHPDANGGNRDAEERLKDINRAYSLLRKRLVSRPPAMAAEPASAAG
jgi:hypothetical protein